MGRIKNDPFFTKLLGYPPTKRVGKSGWGNKSSFLFAKFPNICYYNFLKQTRHKTIPSLGSTPWFATWTVSPFWKGTAMGLGSANRSRVLIQPWSDVTNDILSGFQVYDRRPSSSRPVIRTNQVVFYFQTTITVTTQLPIRARGNIVMIVMIRQLTMYPPSSRSECWAQIKWPNHMSMFDLLPIPRRSAVTVMRDIPIL